MMGSVDVVIVKGRQVPVVYNDVNRCERSAKMNAFSIPQHKHNTAKVDQVIRDLSPNPKMPNVSLCVSVSTSVLVLHYCSSTALLLCLTLSTICSLWLAFIVFNIDKVVNIGCEPSMRVHIVGYLGRT